MHVCVRSRERDAGYVYRQWPECVFMCTSGQIVYGGESCV